MWTGKLWRIGQEPPTKIETQNIQKQELPAWTN